MHVLQSEKALSNFEQPIVGDVHSYQLLNYARKLAQSSATILITGETGVGKEVIAHYIHHHSKFVNGPFVSINCAAIPETLLEATLFGYEKGAFTGAAQPFMGKFEQAQHGTLFLDEISEISLNLQVKLLRAIQEREIERIAGKATIALHIRILAATNRHLSELVSLGAFRKDLFYRLNVLSLNCLPLRSRPDDIAPLVKHFITLYAQQMEITPPQLHADAQAKLLTHSWPGNVRELENVIHRALINVQENVIHAESIEFDDFILSTATVPHAKPVTIRQNVQETEANLIAETLIKTGGCKQQAAKVLRISPRTLRYKIAKLKKIGLLKP